MARPLRIEYENAWYHVMNRGAGHCIISRNDKDRESFLSLLDDIHQRYEVQTHAYCLMDNHYHLLLHTPQPNISRAIRHLNGVYTQMFNHNHRTDRPLFRGRFKSLIVDNDIYLTRLSRYIHLNPVDAKRVDSPKNFIWSSYRAYLSLDDKPDWLYCNDVLSYFASQDEHSTITNYISYVNDEPDIELRNFFNQKRLGSILGSDSFKKSMAKKVKEYNLIDVPDARPLRPLICPTVHQVLSVTANYYNVSMSTLISSKPKISNWPRLVAIYLCVKHTGHQYITIAQQFERASSNCISQAYRRVKAKVNQCEKVRDEISFILNKLNES